MDKRLTFLALCILCISALASAATFTNVVVYGDSLSDNGNLFAATGQPAPPYYMGRASNGPVAVEQLAQDLHATLYDFAWSGATTGVGNHLDGGTPTSFGPGLTPLPGMQTLYTLTSGGTPTGPNTLFVVWGGPDDLLSPSPLDSSLPAILDRAVGDIDGIVAGLLSQGAQHILVPGMPDLGLTPYFNSFPGGVALGTLAADYFNAVLQASLMPFGPAITYFDTSGFLHRIVADPGAYGFTNVTGMCYDKLAATTCADPNQYLFWDDLHPTAKGHALLGDAFANAVPEPSSIVLTGLGLLFGMAVIRIRRRVQH
jgi:phospholipase/lecithinase/hemolysin